MRLRIAGAILIMFWFAVVLTPQPAPRPKVAWCEDTFCRAASSCLSPCNACVAGGCRQMQTPVADDDLDQSKPSVLLAILQPVPEPPMCFPAELPPPPP